jgi:hypothetical protein
VNNGATAHGVAVNEGNGSAISGTSAGSQGEILQSNGSSSDPTWNHAYLCNVVNQGSADQLGSGTGTFTTTCALPSTPTAGAEIEFFVGGTYSTPSGTPVLQLQLDMNGTSIATAPNAVTVDPSQTSQTWIASGHIIVDTVNGSNSCTVSTIGSQTYQGTTNADTMKGAGLTGGIGGSGVTANCYGTNLTVQQTATAISSQTINLNEFVAFVRQ